MDKKTVAPGNKTKEATATTKKRINKGESLVCGVCGLAVVVEEVGDITIIEESPLICCGKPMRSKARKTMATKK